MFSYWEQQSLLKFQHIVIGAGIVGLSTAIELKQFFPGDRVLVLERGLLPAGASTRNAGFACMGSVTELLDDLQVMNADDVRALFEQRKKGLELLRGRLGDEAIGYAANGSYEIVNEHLKDALDKIEYLNKLLFPVNKTESFRLANDRISQLGLSAKRVYALVENTCEGELHTGKMMRALSQYAQAKGVEVITGAEVLMYEEGREGVTVVVAGKSGSESLRFSCNTLSICTNAFTKFLLPGEDVVPGRGQVLVTKPIPNLKLKGIFHYDKGYYYFREIDGRILIGGGRNLDFATEETTLFATTKMIQDSLERLLQDVVIPSVRYEVDSRWAGIMAFGKDKRPVIKAFSDKVFGAFRMGGMGVAIGSLAGKQLAALNHDHNGLAGFRV